MRNPFWGARLLSVCSSRGCSPWPGMGRRGIQFCTPNSDMKPVLVLSQEQNSLCYLHTTGTCSGQSLAASLPLSLGFHGSLLLAATMLPDCLSDFMLQQLNSIFNTLRFWMTDLCMHQLGGWCFSLFPQTWFQELRFPPGGPSFPWGRPVGLSALGSSCSCPGVRAQAELLAEVVGWAQRWP